MGTLYGWAVNREKEDSGVKGRHKRGAKGKGKNRCRETQKGEYTRKRKNRVG